MPLESPRTMTKSLYESELLRRSFSPESADSVSDSKVISCFVSKGNCGGGQSKSVSLMAYGFALSLSSRRFMVLPARGTAQSEE